MTIGLVAVSVLGGISLGLSPALAALAILICALGFFYDLVRMQSANRAAFWGILFVLCNFLSGLMFGGFASLGEASPIFWIANEGRVFLYYWPALFILQRTNISNMENALCWIFRGCTVLVFLILIVKTFTGFSTFSTHHAAGTFTAALIFYNLFRFDSTRSIVDLAFLLIALLAMFAADSRTSLLTVVIAVTLIYAASAQIWRTVRIALVVLPLAVVMPSIFPAQFERLAGAANAETLQSMNRNLQVAFAADSPIEVGKAFDLSGAIQISGNTNLVIRAYLWGRSLGEGVRSPIFGQGFGRVNDLDRVYSGIPYLFYPVVDAGFSNPANLTAHNGFLQVFAELGLVGLGLLFLLYRALWVGMIGSTFWANVGRASLVSLLLMSITQHAFGAPIYGLSLFLLVALSERMCHSRALNAN